MSIDELKTYLTQDLEDNAREYKKKSIQRKVTKDTDKHHKESCHKDHHKSIRKILLYENRIQVDQNKQLKSHLEELENEEEERLCLNKEKDCKITNILKQDSRKKLFNKLNEIQSVSSEESYWFQRFRMQYDLWNIDL